MPYLGIRRASMFLLVLMVACLCSMLGAPAAHAVDGTLISTASPTDIVFDDVNGILYMSQGDSVLRYDVDKSSFLAPWVLGGSLRGIDVSLDGATVAVADATVKGSGAAGDPRYATLHVVDTGTGSSLESTWTCAAAELGTYDVSYIKDGRFIASSEVVGTASVPCRAYVVATHAVQVSEGRAGTHSFVRNRDASKIAYKSTDGVFGFLVRNLEFWGAGTWTEAGAPLALSRDGLYGVIDATYVGLYNPLNFEWGFTQMNPADMAFSPVRDRLYVSVRDTTKVRVYDSSWGIHLNPAIDMVNEYDVGYSFSGKSTPFGPGKMCFSNDERRMFVIVGGGVRALEFAPDPIAGHVWDRATGLPMSGVTVVAYNPYKDAGAVDEPVALAVTAADGSYSMDAWSDAYYRIAFVEASGAYRDLTWPNRGLPVDWSYMMSPGTFSGPVDCYMPKKDWLKANRVVRVAGSDRYSTAVEISKANFLRADAAVIVSGEQFPDALSAGSLAGVLRGPLLLTRRDAVSAGTVAELKRLGVKKVYFVGGESAVSAKVVLQLKAAGFNSLVRVSGPSRYATSAAVAREVIKVTGYGIEPFICRGDSFPDALSASPYSYMEARPILLVSPTTVSAEVGAVWHDMSAYCDNTAVVIGGPSSIQSPVMNALKSKSAGGVLNYISIYGADRYETNYRLIDAYQMPYDVFGYASGVAFPDALAGGAACGYMRGPIVITQKVSINKYTSWAVLGGGKYGVIAEVFGGTAAVSEASKAWLPYFMDSQSMLELGIPKISSASMGVSGAQGLRYAPDAPLVKDAAPAPVLRIDPSDLMRIE